MKKFEFDYTMRKYEPEDLTLDMRRLEDMMEEYQRYYVIGVDEEARFKAIMEKTNEIKKKASEGM